jgi:hypothetical protein
VGSVRVVTKVGVVLAALAAGMYAAGALADFVIARARADGRL